MKSERARIHLLNTVKVLQFKGQSIDIHEFYPSSRPIPNEKILSRDLPFSVTNDAILNYLNKQPGIAVKSSVIAAKIRDENNELTQYYSGDRFVFVKGNFSPALPSNGLVDYHKCRIWHKSQEKACFRCRNFGHSSVDYESCPAYTSDTNIIMIRSAKYVLCNFYMFPMRVFEMDFPSAEHAYQWRFMKYIGYDELAQEILEARTPAEAKDVSSRVPNEMHKDWHCIKMCIMKEILHAKADYCQLFRSALKESMGKRLVECTQDMYWASGLPPRYTLSTKPEHYPGFNTLGRVLESVRSDLIKESLMDELLDVDTHPASSLTLLSDPEVPALPSTSPPQSGDTEFDDNDTDSTYSSDVTLPSPSPTHPSTPKHDQKPDDSTQIETCDKLSNSILEPTDTASSSTTQSDDLSQKPGSRIIRRLKGVSRELSDAKHKGKNSTSGDTPMSSQTTITSLFEAMKRKRSPGKDTDPMEESQKLHCGDDHSI